MIGNLVYEPHNSPFLLDESLTTVVAQALKLVGHNIVNVETAFGWKGITDDAIIEWCQVNRAIWIHADDRAKRVHRVLLQTSGIRTIWVFRPGGKMTAQEQLRILTYAIPKMIEELSQHPNVRHYRVSAASPTSTPSFRRVPI